MELDLSDSVSSPSLLQRIRRLFGDGTSALFLSYGSTAVLRLGSNMILTRLLAPDVFGLAVIITSAIFILQLLTDIGTNAFVVRHKTGNEDVFRTLWTVRLFRGIGLFLLVFAAAPLIAAAYNAPELAMAMRVSAVIFILDGASSIAIFIGTRDRRILRSSALAFLSFVLTTLVTIVAAYYLRSYWAMVISSIFGATLSFAYSYLFYPKFNHRLSWNKEARTEIWNFSKVVIPSSCITIFLSEIDKIVMANAFPKEELGLYMLAVGLAAAVSQLNGQYIHRVFSPKFAHIMRTAPETLNSAYYSIRIRFMLLMAFAYGGLIATGDLVAQILFDDRYLKTGFYLSIVAFGHFAAMFQRASNEALVNLGHMRATLVASIVRLVWMLAAIQVGYLLNGPVGVIIAIHLSWWVLMVFQMYRLRKAGVFILQQELLPFLAAALGLAVGFLGKFMIQSLIEIGWLPQF